MTKESDKPGTRKTNGAKDKDELRSAASGEADGEAPDGALAAENDGEGEEEDEEDEEDEEEDDEDEDDEDEDDEDEPSTASATPAPVEKKSATRSEPPAAGGVLAPAGHAHAVAGHDDHEHGLAHVTPVSLLAGVLTVLLVLTVVTVYTAGIDLGAQWNLVLALVIATVKAGLVVTYFMHLRWDKKLHLLVFLSSVLFLILFLSMALTDRREYQRDIDVVDQKAQAQ